MNEVSNQSKSSISAYRIFGWVPFLLTVVLATGIAVGSILRDM